MNDILSFQKSRLKNLEGVKNVICDETNNNIEDLKKGIIKADIKFEVIPEHIYIPVLKYAYSIEEAKSRLMSADNPIICVRYDGNEKCVDNFVEAKEFFDNTDQRYTCYNCDVIKVEEWIKRDGKCKNCGNPEQIIIKEVDLPFSTENRHKCNICGYEFVVKKEKLL